jgi:hypothetical protein
MIDFSEHDIELGFHKSRAFFEWLNNYQLFKEAV